MITFERERERERQRNAGAGSAAGRRSTQLTDNKDAIRISFFPIPIPQLLKLQKLLQTYGSSK